MENMEVLISQYKVYVDGKDYAGIASVTLPTLTWLSQTINGSGIAGNAEFILPMMDAMTLGLNFRTTSKAAIRLSAPQSHTIELRACQEGLDSVTRKLTNTLEKHVFTVQPKSHNGGTVQTASSTDGSGEYAVQYWKTVIGGEVMRELDVINSICIVDGKDYLEDIRKILG